MTRLGRALGEFGGAESGAVTVDWVAATSGVLLLGMMVVYSIFGGVADLTASIGETLAGALREDPTDSESTDASRTGNASDRACVVTGKFTVCMGPKN